MTYAKDSWRAHAMRTLHPCRIQWRERLVHYREYDIHLTSRSADLAAPYGGKTTKNDGTLPGI
jgi:hypothetical protein